MDPLPAAAVWAAAEAEAGKEADPQAAGRARGCGSTHLLWSRGPTTLGGRGSAAVRGPRLVSCPRARRSAPRLSPSGVPQHSRAPVLWGSLCSSAPLSVGDTPALSHPRPSGVPLPSRVPVPWGVPVASRASVPRGPLPSCAGKALSRLQLAALRGAFLGLSEASSATVSSSPLSWCPGLVPCPVTLSHGPGGTFPGLGRLSQPPTLSQARQVAGHIHVQLDVGVLQLHQAALHLHLLLEGPDELCLDLVHLYVAILLCVMGQHRDCGQEGSWLHQEQCYLSQATWI
ncbi:uncharacterized protein LOC120365328 [Saimiri boliviensis]|uniref:uncharacterized protein LOC120365328 n=1 Tax=Saimiri boliviensis TaxID=27679 RepID=UPI003D7781F9